MEPELSKHFKSREPSAIRLSQIEFMKRNDNVTAINTAIGNVSLPMHPAMQKRLHNLDAFKDGVVKYSATVGYEETNKAFLNVISSSGFKSDHLFSQITDGGTQGMELMIVGTCGGPGTEEKPLLLIDAAYTNYMELAKRLGRKTVSIRRDLQDHGKFTLPEIHEIEEVIKKHKPGAMVVIPYDNPTGHFYDHKTLVELAKMCVKYNLWMVSDEAYRELHYVDHDTVSVWGITNDMVPGIEGRRISIETSSKVWNACGLRIGALVTDNQLYHEKSVAENTVSLCPNVIGQYIFGALVHESAKDLKEWYGKQRKYYHDMLVSLTEELKGLLPGVIVSSPDASIYSVVDVKNIAENFDAKDFVLYCAQKGNIDGHTLLVSPMAGFYSDSPNPGKTQMRIAYVEKPEMMKKVPKLFAELFKEYQAKSN